jgi:hypothetical protein
MFSFLFSDQKKIFRKMGYFNDQEGIMNRYIREAGQWKQHLENTKAAILKAASNVEGRKIAILGSGWLLDVPLTELSSKFKQIWLFDIKHPAQIKHKTGIIANVKLIETDISGFAIPLYNMVWQTGKSVSQFSPDSVKPVFDFDLSDFDLVVSCNVLNQLDILLVDYLRETLKIPSTDVSQLRKLIQETHLHMLPKSKTCLISDVEEISVDRENRIVGRKSLVHTELLPENFENEWVWKFDTHFTYRSDVNTWFRVVALNL